LVESISRIGKMSRSQAELLVETVFDCMGQSLRRGERIDIRGFATFQVRSHKPYTGRDPRTGRAVEVRTKRLPYFKVSKGLAERIRQAGARNMARMSTQIRI
jgi:integration host factor subunit beta